MKHKVIISKKNGTFPIKGLNELLAGRFYNQRTRTYQNPVKRDNDRVCLMAIRKQLGNLKIENPIKCIFYVFAQDKKHDRGNLSSSIEKSFLDAMQTAKVIKNDTWDNVLDSEFHTYLDRENPRVIVEIIEVERY